jgi:hypothetical protein
MGAQHLIASAVTARRSCPGDACLGGGRSREFWENVEREHSKERMVRGKE